MRRLYHSTMVLFCIGRLHLSLVGVGVLLFTLGCSPQGDPKRTAPRKQTQSTPSLSCSESTCQGLCCESTCINQNTDADNCGACGNTCGALEFCVAGSCLCIPGTAGCAENEEENSEPESPAPCEVGETRSCYDGPEGTMNVGTCIEGTQVCSSAGWAPCVGQILPQPESCQANQIDEDCDGINDNDGDYDGDGWTNCGGDCCDSGLDDCPTPSLVNPGAYDFVNNIDDDCDGTVDNTPPRDCSTTSLTDFITASDLVEALDLCTTSTPSSLSWGVISSELLRADGTSTPSQLQLGVLERFGSSTESIPAQDNNTLGVLSSGIGRGVGDPGFDGQTSYSSLDSSPVSAPADYRDIHGTSLQTAAVCPSADALQVQDSVLLRLRIRVPTNALGLEYKFRFFSYEYPVYLCTQYNDFYLALLSSGHDLIPDDKNISFDAAGNPVTINSAFFTSCESLNCNDSVFFPMQQGPDANNDGCVDSLSCNPQTQLCENQYGACPDGSDAVQAFTETQGGGGTDWLTTTAPVIPGEIITLEFHIWDTTDSALDSTVLLDAFRWRSEPTGLNTQKN